MCYDDVTFPTIKSEISRVKANINAEIDKFVNGASVSDSGIVSRLAKEVRGHQQFEEAGGEEVPATSGVFVEPIMVADVPTIENIQNEAIKALDRTLLQPQADDRKQYLNCQTLSENNTAPTAPNQDKNEIKKQVQDHEHNSENNMGINSEENPKLKIHLHNQLMNEYTENPALISKCFPTLFPLGITRKDIRGSGPLSPIQRRTLLLFYDRRFSQNQNFIFHHFNQEMRKQTNRIVGLKVDRGGEKTKELLEIVNRPNFTKLLSEAVENPNSEAGREVKKKILPQLKIFGANVKWSPFERKSTLGRHYALYHAFGMPFLFGTISPGMRNSPLALRMCAKHSKKNWCLENGLQLFPKVLLSNIHARDNEIMKNPVAAAEVFQVIMNAFFTILLGIPLEHLRGKKSDFTRILASQETNFIGAYGKIRAVYGIIEAQGSGGLHLHFHG